MEDGPTAKHLLYRASEKRVVGKTCCRRSVAQQYVNAFAFQPAVHADFFRQHPLGPLVTLKETDTLLDALKVCWS